MYGPAGHFAAGLIAGIVLSTSVVDAVLLRSRPTTIVHCSGGGPLPALASEATGWSFLDTLSYLVQLGLLAVVSGCSIYTWFTTGPTREGVVSSVPEISDVGPVVSTPSSRRRKA